MDEIFAKPGRDWDEEEQRLCLEWLLREEQLSRLMKFVSSRRGSHLYDAHDAWSSFFPSVQKHVIRQYDPARGMSFWNFLLFCLQRHCLREMRTAQQLRSREELVGGEEEISLLLRNQRAGPDLEKLLVIKDLVEKGVDELYRKNRQWADVLVAVDLKQKTTADLAAASGVKEPTLRVHLHRARHELKSILDRLQRSTEGH